MFLLLFGEFRNIRQPALILLAVPLAALGGLVALHLRGITLNVSSAVGFIALFGVAVLNAIIMVANLNRWRQDAGLGLKDAVLNGARERLRPVLMTATVAALGLTPRPSPTAWAATCSALSPRSLSAALSPQPRLRCFCFRPSISLWSGTLKRPRKRTGSD